jgi:hypothetical protein
MLEHLPIGDEPECVREVAMAGSAGQVYHGGVKSGLFLAGYVVGGSSEESVAANMERVVSWFAERVRWRPVAIEDPALKARS